MPHLPIPSAAIFDMDGLIFDTERLYHRALLEVAAQQNIARIDKAVADATIGLAWPAVHALLARLGAGAFDPLQLRHDWLAAYEALAQSELVMKIGVVELLDELARHHIPCAVATGSFRAVAHRYLTDHGLIERFSLVVTHEDYAQGKPAPDPFLLAAAGLGVAPHTCWALEDSANGIRSAHAAGMLAIMVPDLIPPDAAIAAKCTRIATDLLAVRDFLAC